MRTRIIVIKSHISYAYVEEKSPKEVIEEKLTKYYDNVPFEGGKIVKIYDIQVGKYAEMTTYSDSFELSLPFTAKVEIKYFNIGDVLFNVMIREDESGIYDIRKILGTESQVPLIARGITNITNANVIISGMIKGPSPMYKTQLAIYPNYAPITSGSERSKTTDIESPFYILDKIPNISKHVLHYIDPLSDLSDAKRRDRIVHDIRKFMDIIEEPVISGIDNVLKQKKPSPMKENPTSSAIEVIDLADLEDVLAERRKNNARLDLIYVPSFPLHMKVVAVVTTIEAPKNELSPIVIKCFIHNVEEYIRMKYNEAIAIDKLLKSLSKSDPLFKMYDERRKIIVAGG